MRAIVLGGTGAIGGATAMLLVEAGWQVEVTGRDRSRMPQELTHAGVRFHHLERGDARGVERLVGEGADLLVDLIAYSAEDVRAMLPAMSAVRCPVLVSSRAVYTDDAGRHLNGDEPPRFGGPLPETAPTLPPAPEGTDPFTREGYGPCKAAAELTALDSGLPVTVIRPSKVHGRWARNARTRTVIERMREGDRRLVLARADTVDHLTAARNAAALIAAVAERPARRILNAADPDTPTAEQIVRAVAAELSWRGEIHAVPDSPDIDGPASNAPVSKEAAASDDPGSNDPASDNPEPWRHPWQTSMVLDMSAARELGYEPAGNGLDLIAEEVRWILAGEPI